LSPVGSGLATSETTASLSRVSAFSQQEQGWVGGSADYFRDARARKSGDIVTVKIAIDDKASLNNVSNRARSAAADAELGFTYSLMGVKGEDISGKANIDSNSSASGIGTTARSEKIALSVAAVVSSVLPNGYLVIEGSQEVLVNFEARTLNVAGVVDPGDITPDNTISYEKIAEARISYGGAGRLSDVQQPGWLHQIWDRVSPF
jgi:flagellar L-ring protein precursor FlgH